MYAATITPGLCECGCGGETRLAPYSYRKWGWVKGEPLRFIKGHRPRLQAKGFEVDENGCWLSNRAIGANGYAVDWKYGSEYRKRYIEKFGHPGPGMDLHHKCENRRCVNPDHLEALSRADHRNRHAKTTPEQRVEIATRANAGERAADIAADYGIKKGLVHTYAYKQRKGLL